MTTARRDPTPWTSAELFDPMDNALNLSNRGRSEVDYLTPFRALDAPVERCEVSRPVSRVAPLVFLAPALCSSGHELTGNHTSPLIVPPMSRTASLASCPALAGAL